MLLSLVLQVRPRSSCRLPATLGNALHAVFLNLVARSDWRVAQELHATRREKPFAVSPLQGEFTTGNGSLYVSSEKDYWIRFTSVDGVLSSLLLELKDSIAEVEIFDEIFEVTGAMTDVSQHPWAGLSTFEDMYSSFVATPTTCSRRISMHFSSPTTFRSGWRNTPLPIPRLVFLHLSQKWNAFSRINLGANISNVIDERVSLSRHSIRTRIFDFGKHRQVGFVGDCEFLIHGESDIPSRVFHLLASFAFYSGIGHKTTMGMGQAKLVRDGTG